VARSRSCDDGSRIEIGEAPASGLGGLNQYALINGLECLMLPTPSPLAGELHEANCRLDVWMEGLISFHAPARPATPQQMAGLLSELMRAGEWLRRLPSERDAGLELELDQYRKNVDRLRTLLPSIHSALLLERARLEQERTRVKSVAEWARGSRQTL
jgi:hypothetical protein